MASYTNNTDDELIQKIEVVNISKQIEGEEEFLVGVNITTCKQIIEILISEGHECCEVYSVNIINGDMHVCIDEDTSDNKLDDLQALLLNQSIRSIKFGTDIKNDSGRTCAIPIFIETNSTMIEVQLYNDHNGYYAHKYFVSWMNYKDAGSI